NSFHEILEGIMAEEDSLAPTPITSLVTEIDQPFDILKYDFKFKVPNIINTKQSPYLNKFTETRHKSPYTSDFVHPAKAKEPIVLEAEYNVSELSAVGLLALNILLDKLSINTLKKVQLSTLKKAFRTKARNSHPDLNPQAEAIKFAQLKESYDLLCKELKKLRPSSK
ncbi:MAG: DnaJ domain-containing protein, partial [Bdellovibrionales bacterium]